MAVNFEEKRYCSRIEVRTPLRYQIRGTAEFNNVISNNIGLGGVGFINNKFIAPKTFVTLEVNILSRILNPIGKIAWANPLAHSDRYQLGIEFLEFDSAEKKYLKDYIDMLSSKL